MTNRVRFAISSEGYAAYPQSNDGRHYATPPQRNIMDEIIVEAYSDPDEALDGTSSLDKAGQAAIWRRDIESALDSHEFAALRLIYADESRYIEKAVNVLREHIFINGRDSYYIESELWMMAIDEHRNGSEKQSARQADEEVSDQVHRIFHKACKRANQALDTQDTY